jgi:hypothetical protein
MGKNSFPILDLVNAFNSYIVNIVPGFDNKFKYSIGQNLISQLYACIELTVTANNCRDRLESAKLVRSLYCKVLSIGCVLDTCLGFCQLSIKQRAYCDVIMNNILKEAKGWEKYFLKGEIVQTDE